MQGAGCRADWEGRLGEGKAVRVVRTHRAVLSRRDGQGRK